MSASEVNRLLQRLVDRDEAVAFLADPAGYVKANGFKVTTEELNAVVTAINSGWTPEGGWNPPVT